MIASNPLREPYVTMAGRLKAIFGVVIVFAIAPLAVAWFVHGKSVTEKMLTTMVFPGFVICLIGITASIFLVQSRKRLLSFLILLFTTALWMLSTPWLSNLIVRTWEQQIESSDLADERPYDVIVVLGGATGLTPYGRPQLTGAGDRVLYAARMYRAGRAKRLVTTGDKLAMDRSLYAGDQSDPRVETRAIWIELGVPNEDIDELNGENTYSELRSLSERKDLWESKRCGVLTSAFHMPRAMQLARQFGVRVEPVTADYRGGRGPYTVHSFLPDFGELGKLQMIAKEWLGMQLGR